MSKKSVIVERVDLDHDGYPVKKTIMRVEPRYLETIVTREGLFKSVIYSLNEEGVEHYTGKYDGWNPEHKGYYRFNILSKGELLSRIEEYKKQIDELKNVIEVLEDPNNINI